MENLFTEYGMDSYSASKHFWDYVKHKRTGNTGIVTLKVENKFSTAPKENAKAVKNQFESVFSEKLSPT